ncbi:MAG: phage integrase N-terminal SAM-like domain-containing protein, partial [Clostridia bacterium]|nr:phage integrase N-terminal SAM-like domain-containing protein [Clostridia bacterium]
MKRLQMQTNSITFEQGCNKYLDNCRQRNLRQGTINHYKQSYTQFYKFFEPETPIEQITEKSYNSYVLHLRKTLKVIVIKERLKVSTMSMLLVVFAFYNSCSFNTFIT